MNSYYIDEPAVISLSGGRTSGYMLYKILEAHGGLPDWIKVVFANTGKEMPQTLDFVRDMQDHWGVDVTWVELASMKLIKHEGKRNEVIKEYKIVDYDSAARAGEPFSILLQAMPAIPNVRGRYCTGYLKRRAINWLMRGLYPGIEYMSLIGLRADEHRRAVKIRNTVQEGTLIVLPMYDAGDSVEDVAQFWESNNFDLDLPLTGRGVTDWGNCDLCFLKATSKRLSIITSIPEIANWWIEIEEKKQQRFRRDTPSYKDLQIIAKDQGDLFGFDDETIPCFCGD